MSSKISKFFLPFFLFFVPLLFYIHNLSRSVYGGDTGDFIASAATLGVPHPPGYPLFTFLGFLLTRINFLTPAFMVGLIAATSSALSVLVFYLISLSFTKNKLASFIASLVLSFNFLFWFYAEIAEVFSLNVLLMLVLLLFAVLFVREKMDKYFFALSFFVGLSLTNHQTIILIFPTILIIIFKDLLQLLKTPKNFLKALLFFALGFSVYLYVPVANLFNPKINWITVNDLHSFLRLFLRSDYGTFNAGPFLPGDLVERITVVRIYLKDLVYQLTIPVVVLSIAGFVFYLKKNKKIFLSLLLGFLLSGPLFIAYADFPLSNSFYVGVNERFLVMSSVILLLFLPFGLSWAGDLSEKLFNKKTYKALFIGIFLIIPFSLFYYNLPKTDLSKVSVGDDFAYDYLNFLPKNTFLVMGGDTPLLNVWYVHYALGVRKDVMVVNINQLINDKYYLSQRNEYLKKNPKDEKNVNLRLKVFEYIASKRPVYSYDPLLPIGNFDKISWVPYGLVVRLYLPTDTLPKEEDYLRKTAYVWGNMQYIKNLRKQENLLALGSASISDIPSQYANSLLLAGDYVLSKYEDKKTAVSFFENATKTSPDYYRDYQILGIYYLSENNCMKAKENLEKAITIYPFDQELYYFLYSTYKGCFKDDKSAQQTISEYKTIFKRDFFKDLQSSLRNK